MKAAIVIPLYNEMKHIKVVLTSISKYKITPIVVDDGSRDSSGEVAVSNNAILITHKVNLGKGAAMVTGAEYAFNNGYDAIIFMDADGQHDASDLPKFINELKNKKSDVVLGYRNLNKNTPFVRAGGNRLASLVIKFLFGIKIWDPICGFRAITKFAYRKIKWESTGYAVESEMLAKSAINKLRITQVPVKTIYHDVNKGVSMLDAFGVLADIIRWRLIKE